MAVTIRAGFTGNTQPLTHPRIGWRRITGTISASTAAAGFAAANAGTYRTDSFWRPTGLPASWTIDAGSAVAVSYIGIAAHDLGTKGCTVTVSSSPDNVTFTTRVTIVPTDDSAIMGLFASATVRYWRIDITGASGAPTIGVIQFGAVTEFPRPCVYAPSVSFERTRSASYRANISDGGQWLGRSRARVQLSPVMEVQHLAETWLASEWDAFALHAEQAPFFIADRPGSYVNSVAYAWTTDDLRAERGIPNAAISSNVSLSLSGFFQ
jgi:hypothetical protein